MHGYLDSFTKYSERAQKFERRKGTALDIQREMSFLTQIIQEKGVPISSGRLAFLEPAHFQHNPRGLNPSNHLMPIFFLRQRRNAH